MAARQPTPAELKEALKIQPIKKRIDHNILHQLSLCKNFFYCYKRKGINITL